MLLNHKKSFKPEEKKDERRNQKFVLTAKKFLLLEEILSTQIVHYNHSLYSEDPRSYGNKLTREETASQIPIFLLRERENH